MKRNTAFYVLLLISFVSFLQFHLCAEDIVISGVICGQVVEEAASLQFTFSDKDMKNLQSLATQNIDGFDTLEQAFTALTTKSFTTITSGSFPVPLPTALERSKWEIFRRRMAPWYSNPFGLAYKILRVTVVTFIVAFVISLLIAFVWSKLSPMSAYMHLRRWHLMLKHVYFFVIPQDERYLFEDDIEDDADFEKTAKVNEILLKIPTYASEETKERAAKLARLERFRKLRNLKKKRQIQEGLTASYSTALEVVSGNDKEEKEFETEDHPTNRDNLKDSNVITDRPGNSAELSSSSPSANKGPKEEASQGATLFSVSLTIGAMVASMFI